MNGHFAGVSSVTVMKMNEMNGYDEYDEYDIPNTDQPSWLLV